MKRTPPDDPLAPTTSSGSVPAAGPASPSGTHSMRRGGPRREVSERVTLRGEDESVLEGWALNVSRGGLRAILEEKVLLGQKFAVTLGSEPVLQRDGRIVWLQEEPDGVIVGIEFVSPTGSAAPASTPTDE